MHTSVIPFTLLNKYSFLVGRHLLGGEILATGIGMDKERIKTRAYRFMQVLSGPQAFESCSDERADKWIQ
jgi:hypothetical protein